MLDQPDGPFDDRPRASVVDLEVHPTEAGQSVVEGQDPPDVGQPPAVDRLVVVADEEDPVGRRRQQERQPELRPIDVLDLVDEQLAAPVGASGRAAPGRASRTRDRAQDEIVEVEAAARGHGAPRRRRRPSPTGPGVGVRRDVRRVDAELDLEPRERRCRAAAASASSAHGRDLGRIAGRSTSGSTATPASRQDLAARGRGTSGRGRSPGATPSGATAASRRSVISTAARLLKVIARIALGRRRRSR